MTKYPQNTHTHTHLIPVWKWWIRSDINWKAKMQFVVLSVNFCLDQWKLGYAGWWRLLLFWCMIIVIALWRCFSFSSTHKEPDSLVLLLGCCPPRAIFTRSVLACLLVSAPCAWHVDAVLRDAANLARIGWSIQKKLRNRKWNCSLLLPNWKCWCHGSDWPDVFVCFLSSLLHNAMSKQWNNAPLQFLLSSHRVLNHPHCT